MKLEDSIISVETIISMMIGSKEEKASLVKEMECVKGFLCMATSTLSNPDTGFLEVTIKVRAVAKVDK